MRVAYTPLDARLTPADANGLMAVVRPRLLCAPSSRTHFLSVCLPPSPRVRLT